MPQSRLSRSQPNYKCIARELRKCRKREGLDSSINTSATGATLPLPYFHDTKFNRNSCIRNKTCLPHYSLFSRTSCKERMTDNATARLCGWKAVSLTRRCKLLSTLFSPTSPLLDSEWWGHPCLNVDRASVSHVLVWSSKVTYPVFKYKLQQRKLNSSSSVSLVSCTPCFVSHVMIMYYAYIQ